MDTEHLRWFVVLARTGHMTDAAAQLRVPQPTLSRALARIEADLGTELFDRVGRGLRLNAWGRVLLDHAQRALDELDAARDRIAADRDPERGVVRLAFLHSMASWYVPDVVRRFRDVAPGARFDLREGGVPDVVAALRAGRVELAVLGPRPDGGELAWRPLRTERLCVAVPEGHRFAGRASVRARSLADETLVGLRPGLGLRGLTDEVFAAAGVAPTVAFEASQIPAMEGLVVAGLGVAVVPEPQPGREEPGLVYVPLADAGARREIGLAWWAGRALAPVAERFAEFVAEGPADQQ